MAEGSTVIARACVPNEELVRLAALAAEGLEVRERIQELETKAEKYRELCGIIAEWAG